MDSDDGDIHEGRVAEAHIVRVRAGQHADG
jgi:hypothetical protein